MRRFLTVMVAGVLAACTSSTAAAPAAPSPTAAEAAAGPRPAAAASAVPTPQPTPPLPAFYIESLRARKQPGGSIKIGDLMWRGDGFTKSSLSWPSGGQTMTGTISLPDGPGPFPVVIVNHGHIPVERYWNGQDSGIFGDPMAAHGFIFVAPHYPGYLGSGPGEAGLSTNMQIAVADMDLISSLAMMPQADVSKLAVVGHSQGGGVSQLLLVTDPRVKAVVLHAPVSSDETENARRLLARGTGTPSPLFGDPEQNAEVYRQVSPRSFFAAGQAPVLLIQGTVDHTIPSAHTQATFDALQAKGVQSQLIWVQGGDHDLVGTDLQNAIAAQEAFIRKALGL